MGESTWCGTDWCSGQNRLASAKKKGWGCRGTRCRSAGTCRKYFAIKNGTLLAEQGYWEGWGALVTGLLCMGRFLHSVQRTINQQVQSLVYHRSLRMAAHYSGGETHSGWVAEAFFQRWPDLILKRWKEDPPFLLRTEWFSNFSNFRLWCLSNLLGIGSDGVASSGDCRQAKAGSEQLMAWRISLKVEKYRQLTSKENYSFIRGKLGCCHCCELQLCELGPINMLLCQGLG